MSAPGPRKQDEPARNLFPTESYPQGKSQRHALAHAAKYTRQTFEARQVPTADATLSGVAIQGPETSDLAGDVSMMDLNDNLRTQPTAQSFQSVLAHDRGSGGLNSRIAGEITGVPVLSEATMGILSDSIRAQGGAALEIAPENEPTGTRSSAFAPHNVLPKSTLSQFQTPLRESTQSAAQTSSSYGSPRSGNISSRSDRTRDREGDHRYRRDSSPSRHSYHYADRRDRYDYFSPPHERRSYHDHDRAPLRSQALNYDDDGASLKPEGGEADHDLSVPPFGFQLPVVPLARTAESIQLEKEANFARDMERRRVQSLIEHWVPRAVDLANMRDKIGLSASDIDAIEKAIAEEKVRLAKVREALLSSDDPLGLGLGLGDKPTSKTISKDDGQLGDQQASPNGNWGLID